MLNTESHKNHSESWSSLEVCAACQSVHWILRHSLILPTARFSNRFLETRYKIWPDVEGCSYLGCHFVIKKLSIDSVHLATRWDCNHCMDITKAIGSFRRAGIASSRRSGRFGSHKRGDAWCTTFRRLGNSRVTLFLHIHQGRIEVSRGFDAQCSVLVPFLFFHRMHRQVLQRWLHWDGGWQLCHSRTVYLWNEEQNVPVYVSRSLTVKSVLLCTFVSLPPCGPEGSLFYLYRWNSGTWTLGRPTKNLRKINEHSRISIGVLCPTGLVRFTAS